MTRRHSSTGVFPGLVVRTGDAGVGDEDVDAAERRRGRRRGRFDLRHRKRPPPRQTRPRVELSGGLRALVDVEVPQRDTRAGVEEALGNRQSESLRRSGDDGTLAFEVVIIHSLVSRN